MAKQASRIKDHDFQEKVQKCERLDKTLTYERVRNSVPDQSKMVTHATGFNNQAFPGIRNQSDERA